MRLQGAAPRAAPTVARLARHVICARTPAVALTIALGTAGLRLPTAQRCNDRSLGPTAGASSAPAGPAAPGRYLGPCVQRTEGPGAIAVLATVADRRSGYHRARYRSLGRVAGRRLLREVPAG